MPEPSSYVRVSGTLRLPVGELPGVARRLVLRVLDVGRADAAAEVIVERVRRNVAVGGSIPFEIRIPTSQIPGGTGHSFVVQAHLDVAGTGDLTNGDYFTTQSYPVLSPSPDSPSTRSSSTAAPVSGSAVVLPGGGRRIGSDRDIDDLQITLTRI